MFGRDKEVMTTGNNGLGCLYHEIININHSYHHAQVTNIVSLSTRCSVLKITMRTFHMAALFISKFVGELRP